MQAYLYFKTSATYLYYMSIVYATIITQWQRKHNILIFINSYVIPVCWNVLTICQSLWYYIYSANMSRKLILE